MVKGPRLDLCTASGALFNPQTGDYRYEWTDQRATEPGLYTFEIRGSLDTLEEEEDMITFLMALIDPCLGATLEEPSSLGLKFTYTITDPAFDFQIINDRSTQFSAYCSIYYDLVNISPLDT